MTDTSLAFLEDTFLHEKKLNDLRRYIAEASRIYYGEGPDTKETKEALKMLKAMDDFAAAIKKAQRI